MSLNVQRIKSLTVRLNELVTVNLDNNHDPFTARAMCRLDAETVVTGDNFYKVLHIVLMLDGADQIGGIDFVL